MIATAKEPAVKPTARQELSDVLAWLDDHENLTAQRIEIDDSGVKVAFPRECCEAFLDVFRGKLAKLNRGSYGTNWYVVTEGRWRFECYTPKLPDSEDVTL